MVAMNDNISNQVKKNLRYFDFVLLFLFLTLFFVLFFTTFMKLSHNG